VQCNTLKNWHPMVGVDLHTMQLPGPVPPVPNTPHVVAAMICAGPWGILTGKPVPNVIGGWATCLQKGTDAGPLVVHVCIPPPNLLLPVILLGSASKSYFGASSTLIGSDALPIAVAVMKVVNLNVNCGTIVPTPSGIVVAVHTVVADMTLADFLSGLVTALVESALQAVINLIFNKVLGDFFRRLAGAAFGPIVLPLIKDADDMMGKFMVQEALDAGRSQFASEMAVNAIPLILGDLLGTPQGVSASNVYQAVDPNVPDMSSPVGASASAAAAAAGNATAAAVNNYNNNPAVDEHPSGGSSPTPTDAGVPPSARQADPPDTGSSSEPPDGGSSSAPPDGGSSSAPPAGAH
jgi:hypothetical protein